MLRRLSFDAKSFALFGAAAALYASYFLRSNWPVFIHDAIMHAQYVRYIADNLALPPMDLNGAIRHPPFYYMLCAAFFKIGVWEGAAEPLEYARYVSMIFYLTFIVFGALTIRSVFPPKDPVYYFCLAMLLFWPVGVTKTGAIHCDVMTYAAGMAVIYFIVRWLQAHNPATLSYAFIAAGVAVLAKNSGAMMILLAAAFSAHALWRGHKIVNLLFVVSVLFALLTAWITFQRPVTYNFSGADASEMLLTDYVRMYLYFNPYEFIASTMVNPHNGELVTAFWHYYLRSILLGDYIYWKSLGTVWAFGVVWLVTIVYIVHGLWKTKILPAAEAPELRFLLAMAALYTGLLLYMFGIVAQPTQIADARYIYPIVCIIIIFFGKTLQWHALAGRDNAFKVGRGLALGFVMLTWVLFIMQDYILTKIQ